jgi:hypothetical protein
LKKKLERWAFCGKVRARQKEKGGGKKGKRKRAKNSKKERFLDSKRGKKEKEGLRTRAKERGKINRKKVRISPNLLIVKPNSYV